MEADIGIVCTILCDFAYAKAVADHHGITVAEAEQRFRLKIEVPKYHRPQMYGTFIEGE